MKKLKQVRESLTKELGTVVELGAKTPKASLELAMALGWLNPAFTPVTVGLSFVGLTKKGLELYRKVTNKEPDIEEWVGIAFPLAYVEIFDTLVQNNQWFGSKLYMTLNYVSSWVYQKQVQQMRMIHDFKGIRIRALRSGNMNLSHAEAQRRREEEKKSWFNPATSYPFSKNIKIS